MQYTLELMARDAQKRNATFYYAGGTARDRMRGEAPRDLDIEVYGMCREALAEFLSKYGVVSDVGVSFQVLKFKSNEVEADFTLPRRDSKTGPKHVDFVTSYDPFMDKKTACSRRNFTINSMLEDVLTGEVFDYFGGREDLHNKVLRATSNAFKEDALRVLIGFQQTARFDMKVEPKTAQMCSELRSEYSELSLDRIWMEWFKWSTMSVKPSAGLQFLKDVGWSQLYPEFHLNIGVKQNPLWHPEIFVDLHTMYVCDEAVRIAKEEKLDERDTSILLFSGLLHDSSKYSHSQGVFPRVTSRGHEQASVPLAHNFLYRIGAPEYLHNHTDPLIGNHMSYMGAQTEKAVRRLSERLEPSNIYMLSLLINADHSGRPPLPKGLPAKALRMLELSKKENVFTAKPKRILEGKHLKEMGLTPSPEFGKLISECYKMQLNGEIQNLEEALEWVGVSHPKESKEGESKGAL